MFLPENQRFGASDGIRARADETTSATVFGEVVPVATFFEAYEEKNFSGRDKLMNWLKHQHEDVRAEGGKVNTGHPL